MIAEPGGISAGLAKKPIVVPRESGDPYAVKSRLKDGANTARNINAGGYGSRRSPGRRKQSPRAELLRQHENLARAPHLRPAAVELGNQRLESIAAGAAIQRGLVGEFVTRLIHGAIAHAPEPPR